ncbi:Metallo-beta-lactamase superfamily protein [Grimontia celer]|uniref:Metallo-beta-lactamase superfamily protein n=1 Tax=Grimontia celer TaxID=1796497 RepID=A0A128EXR5_9GAMM|nr:MBL fold metallo-hydrolase [Grimontia celer]CZF79359.1 Metallo-beta-lactamase superfamily protein [Grimontia celer]
MISKEIYSGDTHQWFMFGRDPSKPDKIIDTNQYMIRTHNNALLMDPGGIEIFSAMLASVVKQVPINQIGHIFASHQDPDIISSLGLWDTALSDAKLHAPWLWEGFVRHFGMEHIEYAPIVDQGGCLVLNGVEVRFVPAHYLHSSGNFHVYDPVAKILMSGDVGAALEGDDAPMEVEDFEEHIPKMKGFHQRWMPSNTAKNDWIRRVRELEIDMMCPQHGRVFTGDNVGKFLDWFERLDVGVAVQ